MSNLMPNPFLRTVSCPRNIEIGLRSGSGWPYREADTARGERMLGCFILPPFQRPAAWSIAQKAAFIESIWDGLPIGGYVYNDDQRFDANCPFAWLLDGQQRWSAILDYVAGKFPVKEYRFPELGRRDQMRFLSKEFTMLRTELTSEAECREVYNRLAYGGTPHLDLGRGYEVDGKLYRLVEVSADEDLDGDGHVPGRRM